MSSPSPDLVRLVTLTCPDKMTARPSSGLPVSASISSEPYDLTVPKRRIRSISAGSKTGKTWWRLASVIGCFVVVMLEPERPLCHCFNAAVSTGIFRKRFPVAAKIALAIAGTIADVPHSPIPPGGSALSTMWTSISGASFMRSIW